MRRPDLVQALEDRFAAANALSVDDALRIYEAMWEEARQLGVLPGPDPWEGVEDDVRLARILSSCSPSASARGIRRSVGPG